MRATLNFTNQSNARRAAKRMIDNGKAPASEFEIKADADGLFTIHWLDGESTVEIETDIATAADQPAPGETAPPAATPIPAPPETEVADTDPELAAFETPRLVAELERRGFRRIPAKRARASATAKEPRRSKNAELDAAAARGIVPEKPDVTSHANHHYQKRFDRLAELAAAGDWDAVRGMSAPASIATRRWSGSIGIVYWPLTTLRRPRFEDCARRAIWSKLRPSPSSVACWPVKFCFILRLCRQG
jgi:hypothetical protein